MTDNAPVTAHDPAHIDDHFRERARVQRELADRVEQVVRRGTDIDADLAAVLRRAERGEIGDGGPPR